MTLFQQNFIKRNIGQIWAIISQPSPRKAHCKREYYSHLEYVVKNACSLISHLVRSEEVIQTAVEQQEKNQDRT